MECTEIYYPDKDITNWVAYATTEYLNRQGGVESTNLIFHFKYYTNKFAVAGSAPDVVIDYLPWAEAEAAALSNEFKARMAELNQPTIGEQIRQSEAEADAKIAAERTREISEMRKLAVADQKARASAARQRSIIFWQQQLSNGIPGAQENLNRLLSATNKAKP